ncbi:hypothetical protein RJ639_036922 [Escallonia herrerae]|uniref:DNA-directed RNA polymerase n=1 Tax=Escallonia herrerae TaxID=1293975 RepID=A0AA88WX41_9ASTE|nr:hypothetical protein RJ639_036922 [Escallonia herrerae]
MHQTFVLPSSSIDHHHPCIIFAAIAKFIAAIQLLLPAAQRIPFAKIFQIKNIGVLERALASCCDEASQVSINDGKTTDGACYLELKAPSKRIQEDFWNFLERYGFRFGDSSCRPLLPSEVWLLTRAFSDDDLRIYFVMVILKKIPPETRKKLSGKGYFPQDGYILQYLPVPPNCLSVPDVSDGISVMSSDPSIAKLKKVLKQVEDIKKSRAGTPNFESHEVEANDLQAAVAEYLQVRGTAKSRNRDARFGISKDSDNSSTKAWLEKMKTLFIRKGSGFSSRSVITGDPYKGVGEIGLPFEIAQRITFEERVNRHNMNYLQKLVDEKLCLTYRDGSSTFSLREGSKGHTFLRPGQVVHRRIMDGDTVFINRPPTTHKHSLQALSVYVHDDHTVKINPLICGPLSADFDGDCVHLFYPQSLAAKAEVLELFSVEKQLLSSHTGNLNLQLATDSLLSLKVMFKNYFLSRAAAQQLALFVSNSLPDPALWRAHKSGPLWTALQLVQTALPSSFDCCGEQYLISSSQIFSFDVNRDVMQSIVSEIVASTFFGKGPNEVLKFFDALQPMLMENLFSEGFSVGLEDFFVSKDVVETIQSKIQEISPLLYHLRSNYNELIEFQLESHLRDVKSPVTRFIIKSSAMGNLIDSKSDSAINKVVQQIGFLGFQLSDKGKFYSRTLVDEVAGLYQRKYPFRSTCPSEEFGLVRSCLFHGLDPYQEIVHSISSREVIVRSSRGLTEPGTLFKNLMAILRDVVICYDGTVRNVCSNSIIQFEYEIGTGIKSQSDFAAGEPVGVLAATAMSNPAYKAVLDSSPSSNNSWEMMKEILLCGVNFKNDISDRRVILYLKDCDCGKQYCLEKAATLVKNLLEKVSLKDAAVEFLIEYTTQQTAYKSFDNDMGLVGHIHLNKMQLKDFNLSMPEVLGKCQDTISLFRKKKKVGHLFKKTVISFSECCSSCEGNLSCLKFFWQDTSDQHLERTTHIFADTICPVLLETIIKGDPRVAKATIIWISPDTTTWIRNPCKSGNGELALDIVLEREAVKKSGDAWRIVMDSCLPVIHLIDTKRSIPYAIKQRLSTSVTMVTKGVLKEHLILLANSMTCAGNLVGFNTGGIKALSKSLNVQVPFTEATLFTPKKCFERAAEKCHFDSLSSIVASCSWGKHVAIGTGSSFDVLWDTREVEMNQKDGTDVYNFLQMVRSSSAEEQGNACLGADIDYLYMEEFDMAMSPEDNSSLSKLVFEDQAEFDYDLDNPKLDENKTAELNWEKVPSLKESGGGWEQVTKEVPSGWASVGRKDEAVSTGWNVKNSVSLNESTNNQDSSKDDAWGAAVSGKSHDQPVSWSSRGKDFEEPAKSERNVNDGPSSSDFGGGWNQLESEKGLDQSGSWARKVKTVEAGAATGWNARSAPSSNEYSGGWKQSESAKNPKPSRSGTSWGTQVEETVETPWNVKDCLSPRVGSGGWKGSEPGENPIKMGSGSSWGKKVEAAIDTSWNLEKVPSSNESRGGWKKSVVEDSSRSTGWGVVESGKKPEESSSWALQAKKGKESVETGWGVQDNPVQQNQASGLLSSTAEKVQEDPSRSRNWGAAEDMSVSLASWDNKVEEAGWNKKESWVERAGEDDDGDRDKKGNWSKQVEAADETGWGKTVEDAEKTGGNNNKGWGEKVEEAGEIGWSRKDGWGKKVQQPKETCWQKNDGRGSSATGEWKNRRSGPPSSIRGSHEDSRASGPFTATRQRLDIFTSEEADVLSEIEQIMLSIRRIMNQSRDNDGAPLSADDQSYIIEHVFNYHPDKVAKMGAGIDYVMVSKHTNFAESRCFYIVSLDGRKEDFSYRKCLENFVKEKYPDKAGFVPKYFKKPQPRPGWNRERSVAPEEAQPRGSWSREPSSAPEEDKIRGGWNGWKTEGEEDKTRGGSSSWNVKGNTVSDEDQPRGGWHG